MPRPKKAVADVAEELGDNSSFSARIAAALAKDKDVGGVVKMGSGSLRSDIPYYVSTGVPTLNYAIGAPGIPAGRVTTIIGREGSGKSSLGYYLLAETQKMRGSNNEPGIAILIDSEQRFTRERATLMGLDANQLILVDGATLEKAWLSIIKIVKNARKESFDVPITVVYDSVAGSVTEKRLASEVGSTIVGEVAKFFGAELPRLKQELSGSGVAMVFINQFRSRIEDFRQKMTMGHAERNKVMGQKYSMLAEWPLLYESTLMLAVRAVANLEDKSANIQIGQKSRVTIKKCGISPREGWSAEFDLYEDGIDVESNKLDLLKKLGHVKDTNGWFTLAGEEKKFQRRQFAEVLLRHPELEDIIRDAPLLWKQGVTEEPPEVSEELDEEFDELLED